MAAESQLHREKGDRLVRASVLAVCDNRFVPESIGFKHISNDNVINNHTKTLAKQLSFLVIELCNYYFGWNLNRVHTRQGNVREILIFSRSGNCQGILCCVSEKWIFAKMSGKCQGIL